MTLLGLFGAYTIHERHVGQIKIQEADAKAAQVQVEKNKEVEDGISKGIDQAMVKFKNATPTLTPVAIPSLVCESSSPIELPNRGETSGGGDGKGTTVPVNPAESSQRFNPAPEVIKDAGDADVEIARLKAKVTLLQDIIQTYQEGGLVKD